MSSQFHSPALLITDYYDELITDVDVYTEELLEKYKRDDLMPQEPEPYEHVARNPWSKDDDFYGVDAYNDPYSWKYKYDAASDLKVTPGLTKVHDYLTMLRERVIEVLKNAQQFNLDWFRDNKSKIHIERDNMSKENIELLKSQLFEKKFCFVLKIDKFKTMFNTVDNKCLYRLYTIVCDFYLSYNQIKYLRCVFVRYLTI